MAVCSPRSGVTGIVTVLWFPGAKGGDLVRLTQVGQSICLVLAQRCHWTAGATNDDGRRCVEGMIIIISLAQWGASSSSGGLTPHQS